MSLKRIAVSGLLIGGVVSVLGCAAIKEQYTKMMLAPIPLHGTYVATVSSGSWKAGPMERGSQEDLAVIRVVSSGVVIAPALERYCASVLDRLSAESPVQNLEPKLVVNAAPSTFAYSTPDSHIVVDVGFIMNIKSEDELAFLLGHELAHLILAHHDSDSLRDVQEDSIELTKLVLSIKGAVENDGEVDSRKVDNHKAVKVQGKIIKINSSYLAPAWGRAQEMEADLLAMDLMVRAGYDPEAALDFFDIISGRDKERLNLVDITAEAAFGTSDVSAPAPDVSSKSYWKDADNRIVDSLEKEGKAELARTHLYADQRAAKLETYLEREYANVVISDEAARRWDRVVEGRATQALFDAYKSAFRAEAALERGDLAEANSLTIKGLKGSTSTQSYPRLVRAKVRLAEGSPAKAIQNLKIAIGGERPSYKIYEELAKLMIGAGQGAAALAIMEDATRAFRDVPELWASQISLFRLKGDQARVEELRERCSTNWRLRPGCDQAASGQSQNP